jgi:hypothetical protein
METEWRKTRKNWNHWKCNFQALQLDFMHFLLRKGEVLTLSDSSWVTSSVVTQAERHTHTHARTHNGVIGTHKNKNKKLLATVLMAGTLRCLHADYQYSFSSYWNEHRIGAATAVLGRFTQLKNHCNAPHLNSSLFCNHKHFLRAVAGDRLINKRNEKEMQEKNFTNKYYYRNKTSPNKIWKGWRTSDSQKSFQI